MSFIGPIFHLIHISDNFWELNDWYEDVFNPIEFTKSMRSSDGRAFPTLLLEKRDASLIDIADVCIEPISPSMFLDGWEQSPLGRFYTRFGRHWHSIAWYTTDNIGLYRHLKANDIRFFFNGGGSDSVREPTPDEALFTHPKDSFGALELMQGPRPKVLKDPRFLPDYDLKRWSVEHPLGIERLAYVTVVVKDLDKATNFYAGTLQGKVLLENESDLTLTRSRYIAVGPSTIVELAHPLEAGSLAGKDATDNGDIIHAVAFQVADLDRAEKYLGSKGIKTLARDETTLLADPETTYGAAFRFTTTRFAGDPRD